MKPIHVKAFLVAVCLSTTYVLIGQTSFGVRAGTNLANYEFEASGFDISFDQLIGVDVAFLVNATVAENFSIQPELHFLNKGAKFDFNGIESKQNLNVIEIPVLAKYSFGEAIGGFVEAGPSVGYFISGKNKFDDVSEDVDFDDEDLKRLDFGVQFGAGVNFAIGSHDLFLDVRYYLGLANLADTDEDVTWKTTGLNIGVGLLFGGNK
jgi:hypothetical protein